jgi:hypothetical protein
MTKLVLSLFLMSCNSTSENRTVSKNLLIQSVEHISYFETVKVYYDVKNSNICYLYKYDDSNAIAALSCVKDTRVIFP